MFVPPPGQYSRRMAIDFETPALLLDTAKVERNCRRMRERLEAEGVQLRPHVKTAKNVEVARMALGAQTGPITVSTLREAEYFIEHGFRDILYAVGMVPSKVPRAANLVNAACSWRRPAVAMKNCAARSSRYWHNPKRPGG